MAFMLLVFANAAYEGFIIAVFIDTDPWEWLRFVVLLVAVQVVYLFWDNHVYKRFSNFITIYFCLIELAIFLGWSILDHKNNLSKFFN